MTLDIARIDETRDLLGEEVFAKFLNRLEDEMDVFIAWNSATPAPSVEEVALRCHTLASSAGLYGARDLRTALLAAERAANSGDPVELSKVMSCFATIWDETKLGFRELA